MHRGHKLKGVIHMNKFFRLIAVIIVITLAAPFIAVAGYKDLPRVVIEKLPEDIDGFLALRDKIARTPQGGAAIMIIALIIYTRDKALGSQCLTIAVDSSRLSEGDTYKGYSLRANDLELIDSQLGSKPYIAYSYINGTTPQKGYRLPDKKLKMSFSTNDYSGNMEEGELKVFVKCSGADSVRPVKMKINSKGLWKAVEWSSLILGVKEPLKSDNL